MKRTTISVAIHLLQRLRAIASERRKSMAAIIRETLEEKSSSHRARARSIGIGDSGQIDTSRQAGDERPVPRSWR